MSSPAQRMLEERAQARAARDFARADELRVRLEEMGWLVVDGPDGSKLESLLDRVELHGQVSDIRSRLGQADTHDLSVCVALAGWPEDVRRLLSALADPLGALRTEAVIVDQARLGVRPRDFVAEPGPLQVRVVRLEQELGQAQAWNVAAHLSGGRLLAFVEPSLEVPAQVFARAAAELDGPGTGVAGPCGLHLGDGHDFEPAGPGDVDALEYMLVLHRADFARVGEFDPRFRFYRILDIDYCYQVRAAGLAVRAVASTGVVRHAHRLWESTSEAERERLSRRNFNRFLDRWVRQGASRR